MTVTASPNQHDLGDHDGSWNYNLNMEPQGGIFMWGISVLNPTITVGNIIEIAVLIVGGLSVIIRTGGDIRVMRNEMGHLSNQVGTLNTAFESLRSVLTQVAVQDTRIMAMEKRIEEMSHGRGFIQHEIQGEWPRP